MHWLGQLLYYYAVIIVVRVIFTWFPIRPGTPMAQINSVLHRLTEPVLGRARRIIPPMGMLDISPMIVLFALFILASYLQ